MLCGFDRRREPRGGVIRVQRWLQEQQRGDAAHATREVAHLSRGERTVEQVLLAVAEPPAEESCTPMIKTAAAGCQSSARPIPILFPPRRVFGDVFTYPFEIAPIPHNVVVKPRLPDRCSRRVLYLIDVPGDGGFIRPDDGGQRPCLRLAKYAGALRRRDAACRVPTFVFNDGDDAVHMVGHHQQRHPARRAENATEWRATSSGQCARKPLSAYDLQSPLQTDTCDPACRWSRSTHRAGGNRTPAAG